MELFLIGAALVGTVLAFSKKEEKQIVELPKNIPPAPTPAPVNLNRALRNIQIQAWLNSRKEFEKLTPLSQNGEMDKRTIQRIIMWQDILKRSFPDQQSSGVWGNVTEANTFKFVGDTPFQSRPKVDQPNPNADQLLRQGELRSSLINKFAFAKFGKVTFKDRPTVAAKILREFPNMSRSVAIGSITDVAFEIGKSTQRQRVFVRIKGYTGWVDSDQIEVFETKNKSRQLLGDVIQGL
jgi:hypothetical protein